MVATGSSQGEARVRLDVGTTVPAPREEGACIARRPHGSLAWPLDHPRQVGREEEPHGAQQADDDEHPEEDAVDHHGHVLPVLLHLPSRKGL